MLLELSEVFVCPRCRPAQGLVVLVDRLDGRRVVEGRLGCPGCDLRVPVERGTIRFDRSRGPDGAAAPEDAPAAPDGAAGVGPGETGAGAGTAHEGAGAGGGRPPALLRDAGPGEAALRLAALLGADRAEGYLLLGPGLAPLAAGVAERAPEAEVLALDGGPGEAPPEGVALAVGIDAEALPIVTGRMAGAGLADPAPGALREATRVLREGARLAVLAPGPACREALEELPLRLSADEERAVVAVREAGGFEVPFARFPGGPRPRPDEGTGDGPAGGAE